MFTLCYNEFQECNYSQVQHSNEATISSLVYRPTEKSPSAKEKLKAESGKLFCSQSGTIVMSWNYVGGRGFGAACSFSSLQSLVLIAQCYRMRTLRLCNFVHVLRQDCWLSKRWGWYHTKSWRRFRIVTALFDLRHALVSGRSRWILYINILYISIMPPSSHGTIFHCSTRLSF